MLYPLDLKVRFDLCIGSCYIDSFLSFNRLISFYANKSYCVIPIICTNSSEHESNANRLKLCCLSLNAHFIFFFFTTPIPFTTSSSETL
jgi:hypothetical protein